VKISLPATILVLLWLPAQLGAQGRPVRRFTVQDGLAQSQVTSMIQDDSGFLWIGTQAGLSRWDGMRFITWTADDGLPDDVVTTLALGKNNSLWIGTDSGAVARLVNGFPGRSLSTAWRAGAPVHALLPRNDGRLLIASKNGLFLLDDGRAAQLLNEEVLFLVASAGEQVWAVGERHFWKLGRGLEPGEPRPLEEAVQTVLPGARSLVLLEDGRVLDLSTGEYDRLRLPQVPPTTALAGRPDGTLWIGTRSGLYRRTEDAPLEMVELNVALSVLDVRCLLLDREGDVWVGSWGGGLIEIPPGDMRVWTRATGFPSSTVWDFCEDSSSRIWMATGDAGAVVWDGIHAKTCVSIHSGLRSNRVLSLAAGSGGDLWVGTDDGLFYQPASGRGKLLGINDGLPDGFIRDLVFDTKGRLWVATSGGLACREEGRWRSWTVEEGLPDHLIRGLAIDDNDEVWMASHSAGVIHFDGRHFQVFSTRDGLPTERIWSIMRDHRGRIWGGTDAGIWIHDPGGTEPDRVVSRRDGLCSRNILFLVEDHSAEVWAGTTRGVVHLSSEGKVLEILTAADGLPGSEAAENSGLCDREGFLWMGLDEGVVRMRPEEMKRAAVPPRPVLEALVVDGVPLSSMPGSGPLELQPGVSDLRFEITAPTLRKADRLRFSYKLVGHDPDWSFPSDERHVTYRRLPPGHYVFRTRLLDGETAVPGAELELEFELRPFWYQSLPARIGGAFLLILGLLFLILRRMGMARKRRKELEALVAERTAALEEANSRLEEMSRTDPLTGLGNRRVLADVLPVEMALLRRQLLREGPECLGSLHGIGLLMLDLDHFKSINDRFGHDTGDRVLQAVAEILRSEAREVDELIRWGGEEFIVLARGLNPEGLAELAGRLLSAIAACSIEAVPELHVTASIGFVPYPLAPAWGDPAGESSVRWLVDFADAMLYRAKAEGRRRAVGLLFRKTPPADLDEREAVEALLDAETARLSWAEIISINLDET